MYFIMKKNFKDYSFDFFELLQNLDPALVETLSKKINSFNKNKFTGKIWLFGNGGSQATCSHIATDLTTNTNIKSLTISDADLITCFSNDFGYSKWIKVALQKFVSKKDMVILLSCSGNSPNIIEAAKFCKKKKIYLATLSGFKSTNKLKKIGDINLWVDSMSYNLVELSHFQILAYIVDSLSKKLIKKL